MSTVELLRKVRKYYSSPKRWTKNASARDKDGTVVEYTDATATCHCLFGAMQKIGGGNGYFSIKPFLSSSIEELFPDRCPEAPVIFNDATATTFEDVIAVLDRAIEIAEKEQAHAE